jgi:hypothetical protein
MSEIEVLDGHVSGRLPIAPLFEKEHPPTVANFKCTLVIKDVINPEQVEKRLDRLREICRRIREVESIRSIEVTADTPWYEPELEDVIHEMLMDTPRLEQFALNDEHDADRSDTSPMLYAGTPIRSLDLSFVAWLSDVDVKTIAELPNLEKFRLMAQYDVDALTMRKLVKRTIRSIAGKDLVDIRLPDCEVLPVGMTALYDRVIRPLPRSLTMLSLAAHESKVKQS